MVATGVHILFSLALVLFVVRSERAEPYLVGALAAAAPDIDTFVFRPLLEFGYLGGALWSHRGVTHSLLGAVVVVALLSAVGPWRAAAIGAGSHIALDALSGGVQLFAPVNRTMYGVSLDWLLLNSFVSAVAVTAVLAGLLERKYDFRRPEPAAVSKPVREWLR